MSTAKAPPACRILKAARVFLALKQEEIASAAGISSPTLSHLEEGTREPHEQTYRAVVAALEERGIVFIDRYPGFYFDIAKARL